MARRYNPKDRYYKKAKKDGYVARSAYKLEELDKRFTLLKKHDRVIDLGCAPGSWLQYIAKVVGPKGFVLGYDLAEVRANAGPRVKTFAVDIYELRPETIREHAEYPNKRFNVLLSDLAPKTTGVRDADQARSIGLVEHALALALPLLTEDGVFAAKVFQGRGFDELMRDVRKAFKSVRALRPDATRKGSREAFIIARGLRESPTQDDGGENAEDEGTDHQESDQ